MIKEVQCECGFYARGTEDDLVPVVQAHGTDKHGMDVTRDQVIAQWRQSWAPHDYWGEKDQLFREAAQAFAALGQRYDDGRTVIVRTDTDIQFFRTPEGWKIIQIIDTRRQSCPT